MREERGASIDINIDLRDAIVARRSDLKDTLDGLTDLYSNRLRGKCLDEGSVSDKTIQDTLHSLETELVSDLTSDEILEKLVPGRGENGKDRLRAALRQVIPKLTVTLPEPQLQIRPLASFAFAAAGSLAGMMLAGPLVRLLFGFSGETGLLYGGPIGAGVGVLALHQLAHRPRLITGLLWILGATAIADTLFSLIDGLNPISKVRAWLFGGKPPIASLFKRMLIYATVFVLLVLARPKRQLQLEETMLLCQTAIRGWLTNVFDLVVALVDRPTATPVEQPQPAAPDSAIIDAIVALRTVMNASPTELSQTVYDASAAVLSAFQTVYEVDTAQDFVWDETLNDRYKTFGVVRPGMQVHVIEPAVMSDARIIKRGIVAPMRG